MSTQTTDAASLTFEVHRRPDVRSAHVREAVLADPGFGKAFTDHMVLATWSEGRGWHDGQVTAYGPLSLDPATAVLHYAQEIFEGMKAYRHADGTVWTFRPEVNAARFARSARRLALPELPEADFIASIRALVRTDVDWVPSGSDGGEKSLYLRPFMIASEVFLGVRPSAEVTYCVIASPAGPYFPGGVRPLSIWVSPDYTRAAQGGTGAAKCGGNYAASLVAQREGTANGCDQVVFLDAAEHRWLEELGGMNLFLVLKDGSLVTPELTGTILEGVTRASIIELAKDQGHEVMERPVSLQECQDAARSGDLVEVFACGTAAVITPVGRLAWQGGEVRVGGDEAGPVALALRAALLDIQYGRAEDARGWLNRLA